MSNYIEETLIKIDNVFNLNFQQKICLRSLICNQLEKVNLNKMMLIRNKRIDNDKALNSILRALPPKKICKILYEDILKYENKNSYEPFCCIGNLFSKNMENISIVACSKIMQTILEIDKKQSYNQIMVTELNDLYFKENSSKYFDMLIADEESIKKSDLMKILESDPFIHIYIVITDIRKRKNTERIQFIAKYDFELFYEKYLLKGMIKTKNNIIKGAVDRGRPNISNRILNRIYKFIINDITLMLIWQYVKCLVNRFSFKEYINNIYESVGSNILYKSVDRIDNPIFKAFFYKAIVNQIFEYPIQSKVAFSIGEKSENFDVYIHEDDDNKYTSVRISDDQVYDIILKKSRYFHSEE